MPLSSEMILPLTSRSIARIDAGSPSMSAWSTFGARTPSPASSASVVASEIASSRAALRWSATAIAPITTTARRPASAKRKSGTATSVRRRVSFPYMGAVARGAVIRKYRRPDTLSRRVHAGTVAGIRTCRRAGGALHPNNAQPRAALGSGQLARLRVGPAGAVRHVAARPRLVGQRREDARGRVGTLVLVGRRVGLGELEQLGERG